MIKVHFLSKEKRGIFVRRYVLISDIHGELEMFEQLLEKMQYNPAEDQLVLLGDYVDRGPNSRGVLNKVMELKEEGAIVLRGNHDDMLLAAAKGEENAWERWWKNGALPTLLSYDPTITEQVLPDTEEFQKHIAFIEELDYYVETEDYIFVHGGVDPDTPVAETDPYVLIWIRDKFHKGYHGDKTVVFGHTTTPNLHDDPENFNVFFGENRIIGIDGGAVYGGQLNGLELPSKKQSHIKNTTLLKK